MKKINHVKIAKFVLSKDKMNSLKGGDSSCSSTGTGTAKCVDCTCGSSTGSGNEVKGRTSGGGGL